MNDIKINLLSDRRINKPSHLIGKRPKILRTIALSLLFGIGISTMILYIMIIFSPLPQLRKEEQKARDDLSAYQLEMSKLVFINNRTDDIRQIFNKREKIDKNLGSVQNITPADIDLDGITIVKKNYTFKFSSNNLASMDKLINSIVGLSGKAGDFSRVHLTSLSIDQERHKYILVVDLLSA